MNLTEYVFWWIETVLLGVELLHHGDFVGLALLGTAKHFSKVFVPCCTRSV